MTTIPLTLSGPADGMNCEHEWAGEYLEAEREYHALEEEVHREVDRPAKTRRRGSRAPRSR